MITAIDTNVLLDILLDDSEFHATSKDALERQSNLGSCIISPIVYSEMLAFFSKKHDLKSAIQKLEEFLADSDIQIIDFDKEDFTVSSQAWQKFLGPRQVICPKCGTINRFDCKKCKSAVLWRNHLITDFLIGAHAQNHADILLTRDRGYYKKYFKVRII